MNRNHLVVLFHYLNEVCFKGKLPKIRLEYGKIKREDALAFFEWRDDKPYRIKIDSGVRCISIHFLLLHEMLHYEHFVFRRESRRREKIHSKLFKKRLRALHRKLKWYPPPAWSMRG